MRSSFPSTIKTEECPTGRDEHEKWRLENRKGSKGSLPKTTAEKTAAMSLSAYNPNSSIEVASVPTTLETVSTQGFPIPASQVSSILVEYNGEKKGGHSSGGHSSGSHGSGSEGEGSGSGSGSGSSSGKGGSENEGGGTGSYYYNGRNYQYGYPVYYQGNQYYPRGVILPVAFGGAAGYLVAGHVYHTYTSSSTLYYSEMPTVCGASSASAASVTASASGSQTCVPSGSYSSSFSDGGGLVTIQKEDLVSATYSTLSDSVSSGSASASASYSSTSASVSSISTASKNGAAMLQPGSDVVHYTGEHKKLATMFSFIVTTGLLISLM